MRLTTEEAARLIEHARGDRPLRMAIPSLRLDETDPSQDWAVELVEGWREEARNPSNPIHELLS